MTVTHHQATDVVPIHEGLRSVIDRTLEALGVAEDYAYFSPVGQEDALRRVTRGTWVLWIATDLGLAEMMLTIQVPSDYPDIQLDLVPWMDVAGVRLTGAFTDANGTEATAVGLELAVPALSARAGSVVDRVAYPALRVLGRAIATRAGH